MAREVLSSFVSHRTNLTDATSVPLLAWTKSMNADGILGRLMNHLNTRDKMPFKTNLFGFQNKKIFEGSTGSPYILSKTSSTGIPRFEQLSHYKEEIENMTSKGSHSYFADSISSSIAKALEQTEELGSLMAGVSLTKTFDRDNSLSSSFNQISKIIKLRDQLKLERAGFTAEIGGFDTHGTFDSETQKGFEKINKVIKTFKEEMEAQNAWNDVAVVLVSDFGRTITSNGKGTDHGKYEIHLRMQNTN